MRYVPEWVQPGMKKPSSHFGPVRRPRSRRARVACALLAEGRGIVGGVRVLLHYTARLAWWFLRPAKRLELVGRQGQGALD